MIFSVPKSILRGVYMGISFVLTTVLMHTLIRSFSEAWRSLGPIMFTLLWAALGSAIYVYSLEGARQGAYALISVVLIHLIMWGVGYYKVK